MPANVNDAGVKNFILTKLGLDDNEKLYVKDLSGILKANKEITIKFELRIKPESTIAYKKGEFKITLEQTNETKPKGQPDFDITKANNIAMLPNDKQITLSNTSNSAQVTNNNLSFDTPTSYELSDNYASPPLGVIFSDKYYYTIPKHATGSHIYYASFGGLNENNEYTNFDSAEAININFIYNKHFSSSNNEIYSISKKVELDKYKVYNFSDADPKNPVNITKSSVFDNLNCNAVYNINSKLYIGTDKGLYYAANGTDFSLVSGTDGYNINSIVVSKDEKDVFFGTESNGLFYSNDNGTSFKSIANTAGKTINSNSLFLSQRDNLYFGINNEGLWKTDINGDVAATQLISDHINAATNVKDIAQYYDGTLIVLTNANLVYLQEF